MKVIAGLTPEQKEIIKLPLEMSSVGKGFTVRDLRIADKICKVIESCEDRAELEDADYEFLKGKFNSFDNWIGTEEVRAKILEVAGKLV